MGPRPWSSALRWMREGGDKVLGEGLFGVWGTGTFEHEGLKALGEGRS